VKTQSTANTTAALLTFGLIALCPVFVL